MEKFSFLPPPSQSPLSLTLFLFFSFSLQSANARAFSRPLSGLLSPTCSLSLSQMALSLGVFRVLKEASPRCKEVATLLPVAPPRRHRPLFTDHPLPSAPKQLDVPHRQLFFLFFFFFSFAGKYVQLFYALSCSLSLALGLSPFSISFAFLTPIFCIRSWFSISSWPCSRFLRNIVYMYIYSLRNVLSFAGPACL